MAQWQEIEHELIRMRQSWSSPRDLRKLGPANFELRPVLADIVHRYTRGRCLDFAVRMAGANPILHFAGFYAGNDLIHAFLMDENQSCIEVSGVWTLREMKKLHATDGKFALRHPPLDQVLLEIEKAEGNGADFDSAEAVLSVAGCLPHLRPFISKEYIIDDPEDALLKLRALADSQYSSISINGSPVPYRGTAP
ncbi:hypothetical protein HFN89_03130 [Rhizobium laguerreae]|nr:hypothetical protein [Rhizobium laguerreae]